jgi:ABC-type amino acid transport substrate-binding protein
VRLTRRAGLLGLAALATCPQARAQARVYADTVSTVGESLDEIRAKGRLRVGLYEDFHPFSTMQRSGPIGIDVDIAKLLAGRLGLRLEPVVLQAADTVDDDLRNHVWRGTAVDHATVNLLLHVPYARELTHRNELVVLIQPYFTESLTLARDLERLTDDKVLEGQPIGVELDSLASIRLGGAEGGRLRDGLVHYRRPEDGLAALLTGEIAAFAGLRSQVEAGLGASGERYALDPLPGPGIAPWAIGAAVRENARDLGYAAGDILALAVRDGTMAAIFAAHGVSFHPPPFA